MVTRPCHTSAKPVGWLKRASNWLSGRGRKNAASVAPGRTRLPSSSRIHDLEFIAMKGRPSQVNESSWPKRKSSIVG